MAIVAASARFGAGRYSVSAYGAEDISRTLTGVSATGSVNTVEEKPTEVLDSVSATGSVQALAQVKVSEALASAPATGTIGTVGTTAVVFDFQAVREQYSRRRTVYIAEAA